MMKRLAATLSAAALALCGFVAAPAPARAGDDDLVKLLLGAAAIGLIVTEVNRRGGLATRAAPPPFPDMLAPGHRTPPGLRQGHRDDRRDDRRDRDRIVPASCLFDLPGRYGARPVIGARCLKGWDQRAVMPPACLFDIRPGQGERQVYGLECLRDRGYRIVRG